MNNADDAAFYFLVVTVIFSFWILWTVAGNVKDYGPSWDEKCISSGGLPSYYSQIAGKATHQKRFCIKDDRVIEVDQ